MTLMTQQVAAQPALKAQAPAEKLFFSMPSPQEMHHLIEFCKVMAMAPFYQKLGPGGIMAIYLTAKEHNVPFMASLNGGMQTFDGKVSFSAQLINAMIVNAGHRADIVHLDETRCHIRFWRNDRRKGEGDTLDYEYNIKQAEKAGYLKKNNWQSSPKDMLFSRCLTGGGRKFIPEVFVGVLVVGELVGDMSDANTLPLMPASVAIQTADQKPIEPKQIENQPAEGYAEFATKHDLFVEQDGTMGRKMEYVTVTSDKSGKSIMQVINAAIKNETLFEERFAIWQEKNHPKPRSMGELAEALNESLTK